MIAYRAKRAKEKVKAVPFVRREEVKVPAAEQEYDSDDFR
jgi:hypothetical protein